jgi:hypothetical protein
MSKKQDGDIALALGEFGRFGIGRHQAFDASRTWRSVQATAPKFRSYRGPNRSGVKTARGPDRPQFGEKIIGKLDPDAVFNIPKAVVITVGPRRYLQCSPGCDRP